MQRRFICLLRRHALTEAQKRLTLLQPEQKVQASLVIAESWTNIARLQAALDAQTEIQP